MLKIDLRSVIYALYYLFTSYYNFNKNTILTHNKATSKRKIGVRELNEIQLLDCLVQASMGVTLENCLV